MKQLLTILIVSVIFFPIYAQQKVRQLRRPSAPLLIQAESREQAREISSEDAIRLKYEKVLKNTELALAVSELSPDHVASLIHKGADINARCLPWTQSMPIWAWTVVRSKINPYFVACSEILLSKGIPCDVDRFLDADGDTPAIIAAECNQVVVLAWLRFHGANINYRNLQGFTCLWCALFAQRVETLTFLFGCEELDITVKNGNNQTALEYMVQYNQYNLIKILFESVAGKKITQEEKNRALAIAFEKENFEVVGLLTGYGAEPSAVVATDFQMMHQRASIASTNESIATTRSNSASVSEVATATNSNASSNESPISEQSQQAVSPETVATEEITFDSEIDTVLKKLDKIGSFLSEE